VAAPPPSQPQDKPKDKGQGYGVSGFVNNPFAKLGDLNKRN